ncbi:hypothetical protein DH2020_041715 [Rehmannia glutinosa]|uniref:non-specific serine/threonine protein kinase n=1 Tax=Rehmannia glutinosa TaxID=99300 RepID=A0ABR0URG1_REHGL
MASKTGPKAPFGLQQKASGEHAIKTHDLRSLPFHVSKANKPKPVNPEQSAEPGMVPIEDIESKISPSDLDVSSNTQSGNSYSKISSTGSEQVSTTVDLDMNEIRSSLETSVDQEKKTSDLGSVKNSSVSAKVSDGANSLAKTSGSASAKVSGRATFVESGKSSICRGSTCSDVSDESSCSSFSSSVNKPHKANDVRWEAIQVVRSKDGVLGLSHFRLLKRLGCGDIGSVYLAELSGTNCYFAMKVMDKASLASRKASSCSDGTRDTAVFGSSLSSYSLLPF